MIPWTTPTFTFRAKESSEVDFTEAEDMIFSIVQGDTKIEKAVTPAEAKVVEVFLTQAESGLLVKGKAKVQLNWNYSNGNRSASYVRNINIDDQLHTEVMT